jgi:coenzyme F420-0:L-glutamate ligase/coenzyme F420-1:gamma-L-glutamate ligase
MNAASPLPHAAATRQRSHDTAREDVDDDAFWRVIRGRRSIRRYTDEPIPPALLERILEAATWAPSAHNRQPWRFCAITKPSTKHALSEAMAVRWRADMSDDGVDKERIAQRIAISHARITGAAALIISALTIEEMDSYPDARRRAAEWLMAVQSVALATQNLLLAAHHVGLGACWMCAPLFVPNLVRQVLDLPEAWQPQALITLGYPAETKEKTRAPLETRVVWR